MNAILLGLILFFTSLISLFIIITHIMTLSLDKNIIIKNLSVIFLVLLINIGGWSWLCSGGFHDDGIEYTQIKREQNVKFFTYDGDIVKVNDIIDTNEYSIKIEKYSSQYQNGIYYPASDKGHSFRWSYIKTSDIPKTK